MISLPSQVGAHMFRQSLAAAFFRVCVSRRKSSAIDTVCVSFSNCPAKALEASGVS